MKNLETNIIINRIKFLQNEINLSTYRLAALSDMRYSDLDSILKKPHMPTIKTLCKICEGLDISLSDFFSGIEKDPPNTLSTDEFIRLWNNLDQTSKKYVKIYMKELAKEPISHEKKQSLKQMSGLNVSLKNLHFYQMNCHQII